jgi:hypothetical protein
MRYARRPVVRPPRAECRLNGTVRRLQANLRARGEAPACDARDSTTCGHRAAGTVPDSFSMTHHTFVGVSEQPSLRMLHTSLQFGRAPRSGQCPETVDGKCASNLVTCTSFRSPSTRIRHDASRLPLSVDIGRPNAYELQPEENMPGSVLDDAQRVRNSKDERRSTRSCSQGLVPQREG